MLCLAVSVSHPSVESTALRLITALGSSEVQPQFTRFLNDPKTVLSAESEELNRALILTLARATHVTGSAHCGFTYLSLLSQGVSCSLCYSLVYLLVSFLTCLLIITCRFKCLCPISSKCMFLCVDFFTGSDSIHGTWCKDILQTIMNFTPHNWASHTLSCFPAPLQVHCGHTDKFKLLSTQKHFVLL